MKKLTLLLTLPLIGTLLSTIPVSIVADQPAYGMMQAPGAMPLPNQPGLTPEMTEEELMQWQKEVDSEIDAFVKTLPQEQQDQFHKDVAELTDVMSKMSDDELVQFLGNVFPEEGMQPEVPMEFP